MGQVETSIIKAYNSENNHSLESALSKLWKRFDKKPSCGSLGKKEVLKFLHSACELIGRERNEKNWGSDVPTLEDGVTERWYKTLDPANYKVVSWDDVLRAIGSGEVCTGRMLPYPSGKNFRAGLQSIVTRPQKISDRAGPA
jgi:hypothetical protein